MHVIRLAAVLGIIVLMGVAGTSTISWAQQRGPLQDLIDGIIQDVIGRAGDAAEETIRRNTGVDLTRRGYGLGRDYQPLPPGASEKSRRELRKLEEKHDRKLRKLEEELRRKLDKIEAEFEREAGKEKKRKKVEKKRAKLEKKVNKAYEKFDKEVAKENDHFDKKREKILSKERGN